MGLPVSQLIAPPGTVRGVVESLQVYFRLGNRFRRFRSAGSADSTAGLQISGGEFWFSRRKPDAVGAGSRGLVTLIGRAC